MFGLKTKKNASLHPGFLSGAAAPYLTLRMDVTNRCNLKCIMCHFADPSHVKEPYREVTPDEFRRLTGDIAGMVHTVVLSCGCEPLISQHLPEILRYLARAHPHIEMELCTNAVLLGPEIRSVFIETGLTTLMVSIDAVTGNVFEGIRKGASYDRVIANVLAMKDLKIRTGAGFPQLIFIYVMLNRNIHEAPYFLDLAERAGASAVDYHHAAPDLPGFPFDEMLEKYPEKYNFYRKLIVEEASRRGMTVFLPKPFQNESLYDPRSDPEVSLDDFLGVNADAHREPLPKPKRFPDAYIPRNFSGTLVEQLEGRVLCRRPFTEIMIRNQEQILPCPWYKTPLGLVSSGISLKKVFLGKNFEKLREKMIAREVDPGCAGCPVLGNFLPDSPA